MRKGSHDLLVVEDEPTLRELLVGSLRFGGFGVSSVETGSAALAMVRAKPVDLIVLDVMLPDMDGFAVLRQLRGSDHQMLRDIPVVFLTARDTPEDTVTGLSIGGDDYITKPFQLEELIARIRAILRRTSSTAPVELSVGDLVIDAHGHQVRRGNRQLSLSRTEFRLLHYLVSHVDQTCSKADILDNVWQYEFDGDPSIVETYISYLRRKIDTEEPKLIHTVRSVGYVLRTPR